MKVCSKCGVEKPLDEFYKETRRADGKQSRCKSCCREDRKARWADPDQREINRTQFKEWAEANKDRLREKSRNRARENPEQNRARVKAWRENNPEKAYRTASESKSRRRAMDRDNPVERIDYDRLWIEQHGVCGICGELIDYETGWPDPFRKSVDHIVPISKGGGHVHENVQWSHLRCNLRKAGKVEEAWV